MMDKDDVIQAILVVAVLFSLFVGGCCAGNSIQRSIAVEAGAAEWRVDPKTGETRFVYLSPKGVAEGD